MKQSWLRRALRRAGAGRSGASSPGAQSRPDSNGLRETIQTLTSAQLCRAWRVSFLSIVSAKSWNELEELAEKRRLYLEEMEMRDPTGFRAWLEASPAASSDLEPYLTRRSNSERRRFGSF